MPVTGLKSFESSYCVLKSPTHSDKKCCCMFCLVLINSLTIKPLFLGSVIYGNDMFLLTIYIFFEHGFEHSFERGFEHGFEHSFDHGFEHGFEHCFELELKSEHQCYLREAIL